MKRLRFVIIACMIVVIVVGVFLVAVNAQTGTNAVATQGGTVKWTECKPDGSNAKTCDYMPLVGVVTASESYVNAQLNEESLRQIRQIVREELERLK